MPSAEPPPVLFWYRAFCGTLAIVSLLAILGVLLIGGQLAAGSARSSVPGETAEFFVLLGFYAVAGGIGTIVWTTAALLPIRPWVWTFHLVMLCLAIASCWCMPLAAPLLIYWLKPETKRFFGHY